MACTLAVIASAAASLLVAALDLVNVYNRSGVRALELQNHVGDRPKPDGPAAGETYGRQPSKLVGLGCRA